MRRTKMHLARELRAHPTPAERTAWALLRNRRCLGYKFRRQQVLYGLIVDFYCSELRVAIEVDGGVHDPPERREYDAARDAALAQAGIRVIRLRNEEISGTRLAALVREIEAQVPPLRLSERGSGGEAKRVR